MAIPESLDRKIKAFMADSLTKSAHVFEEIIFDETTNCDLIMEGGVDYAKNNKTLEIANLVLFD
jgi:hypothetical protein